MEPLVIFGALLVVYCGYHTARDAVSAWHGRRMAAGTHTNRPPRASASRAGRRLRLQAGFATMKPLTQRRATG